MMTLIARLRARKARTAKPMPAPAVDDGSHSYAAAMRHSRRVRVLRKAIPMACLGAVVGPIIWGVVSPFARSVADVKVGPISVSGSKITMEAPKLSGFKKDQKAYEVTAAEAIQDIKTPSVIELNKLTARMEQDDKKFARLTSDWGRFDQTAERLDLKGNVRVRTDSGYEAEMVSARINIKTGDVASGDPVTVRSQTGTISADTVEIRENGKIAVFQGRVRSIFVQAEAPASSEIRKITP